MFSSPFSIAERCPCAETNQQTHKQTALAYFFSPQARLLLCRFGSPSLLPRGFEASRSAQARPKCTHSREPLRADRDHQCALHERLPDGPFLLPHCALLFVGSNQTPPHPPVSTQRYCIGRWRSQVPAPTLPRVAACAMSVTYAPMRPQQVPPRV